MERKQIIKQRLHGMLTEIKFIVKSPDGVDTSTDDIKELGDKNIGDGVVLSALAMIPPQNEAAEEFFAINIMELLEKKPWLETIALVGDAGVGKTWMARKIDNFITNSDQSCFYGNLWISMNKNHDKRFLHDVLAHQLSLQSSTEDYRDDAEVENLVSKITKKLEERGIKEFEVFEMSKLLREMGIKKLEELVSKTTKKLKEIESNKSEVLEITKMVSEMESKKSGELERKITKKLMEMENESDVKSGEHGPCLLVILDGVCSDSSDEVKTRAELERLLPKESKARLKYLVTRNEVRYEEIMEKPVEVIIKIEPLPKKESRTLFEKLIKTSIPSRDNFAASIEEIAENGKGLPIAVVVLVAEALNLSGANDLELSKSANALKEIASSKEADKRTSLLLRFAIETLNGVEHRSWSTSARNDTLVNCYWHSWEFVSRHGAIDYNVLILSWILEGYLGPADHIKRTYEEGHRVLMKLIGCGLLKMLEDNLVMMEELVLPIPDFRRVGYEQRSVLGLARVLDESIWKGFGKLAPSDYMIKTPTKSPKQDIYISTLLIHGSRLCREDPNLYFKEKLGLQNLAIFNPRFESLPPLLKMEKLCVLILRGCDQLQKIDDVKQLKSLIVLEISDANFSEKMTEDLFKELTNLQILNLCAVSIKVLPSSLSNLSQLRWLILRRCPFLESLPTLKELRNLEVLDLSGSTSLLKITDKTFTHLQKIQFIDFSQTSIKRLPFLSNLQNLTRLLLRDCKLTRLPSFKDLHALEYLDISGSNMIKEINEDFSKNKDKLKILDLSKTKISRLPSNFGNFPNLELLDLSGASELVEIPKNAFDKMVCLCHLNLSNTKLESLPSISKLSNLRQLFLNNCPIRKLPKLKGAVPRLEELHLSNASSLVEIEDDSFEDLSHLRHLDFSNTRIKTLPSLAKLNNLHYLNLSGTELESLPSISNLTNLTQLSLRGCSVPESGFSEHEKLEFLDMSEVTGITTLPLENLTSLRELKLRGCSKLEHLQHLGLLVHLEALDLWETGIKKFPREIYQLTRLKHLDLPKGIQEFELGKMKHLPEELNWNDCCILQQGDYMPCISFKGTKSFQDLKENPEFHFSVWPEQGRAEDIHWHNVDPFFRKTYFKTLSFPLECSQYLGIVGFDSFPVGFDSFSVGVEDALRETAYVSLIGNKFITQLSDLGVENAVAMKGCWLQRCTEMEKVFLGEKTEAEMENKLEILWASNLPRLKDVCSQTEGGGGFKNLKKMYLDCCPLIKYVFHQSQFPEKLEILQIKFCDDLESLFEPNVLETDKTWSIETLHLVELPKFTSIGVPPKSKKIKEVFPSLKNFRVKECPMLENTSEQITEAGGVVENSNNVEKDW